jgi:predicted GNAT family acetyltransferase
MEPTATRLSNTLGIGAIGVGSAGSFNYAAQQRLERKKEAVGKTAPSGGAIRRAVERFQTANPHGPNSTYHKLPDGRWLREKHAVGEQHVMDHTVFVHPAYGEQMHPRLGVKYSPLEMALSHGELVHPGGKIGIKVAHAEGPSTLHGVPEHHISREPKEGWHPVEYSLHENGAVKKYHLGHPVAPLSRGSYHNQGKYGDEIGKASVKAVGRFARTFEQVSGPVRRSKPITKVGARAEAHFDARAEKILGQIIPTDEFQSGARIKNATWLVNNKGKSVAPFGSRVYQADLTYPTNKGRHAKAGTIEAMVLPTGHIKINHLKIEPWAQGQGIASGMVKEVRSNLKDADSPGMLWRSAGYNEDKSAFEGGRQGYTAWRQKGIKYLPGAAYGGFRASTVRGSKIGLEPKDARQVRRHILAARLGMTSPDRARTKLSQKAQEYLGGQSTGVPVSWYGMLPGGKPFLGKTRRTAGATALATVPAYGTYRWQENQHPRGYGGHFVNKSMVAPGSWTPVSALTQGERIIVRNANMHSAMHRDAIESAAAAPKKAFAYARLKSDRAVRLRHDRYDGDNHWWVIDNKDQRRLLHRNQMIFEKSFLGQYRDRLSPEAEAGYKHLRYERNENIGAAAGSGTIAGLSGWLLTHELKSKPIKTPSVAVTGASTLASAYGALRAGRVAHRRDKSMNKIEAKARARKEMGLYGPGRGKTPVDTTSAKARKYAPTVQGMDGGDA